MNPIKKIIIAIAFLLVPLRAMAGVSIHGSCSSLAYGTRTSSVITAPGTISDDDILFVAFASYLGSNSDITITPPAGFTAFTGYGVRYGNTIGDSKAFGWWKRASSESGDYTFVHTSPGTQDTQAIMCVYSGAVTSGSVEDVAPSIGLSNLNTGSESTTYTAPDVTVATAGSMAIFAIYSRAGMAGVTPPTGFTERHDNTILYVADDVRESAGATGALSVTSTSSLYTGGTFVIKAQVAASTTNGTLPAFMVTQ